MPDPADGPGLSASQSFELERFSRAIDAATDLAELRAITKQLLQAWQLQRAATNWAIRQGMRPRP